jgi:hypothetical protein
MRQLALFGVTNEAVTAFVKDDDDDDDDDDANPNPKNLLNFKFSIWTENS